MKCRVCGAELKKDGELCNNCLNRLQQEEAIRGDKTPVYGFKSTFILGYELLRHCEQIGIVIFMIALIINFFCSSFIFIHLPYIALFFV